MGQITFKIEIVTGHGFSNQVGHVWVLKQDLPITTKCTSPDDCSLLVVRSSFGKSAEAVLINLTH